jgi:sialic acid synthase SpsE
MKKFNIGKILIDKNSRPLIIPEIGINHFGSLKLAKKIVDEINIIIDVNISIII